jgi:hypothetical protein
MRSTDASHQRHEALEAIVANPQRVRYRVAFARSLIAADIAFTRS